MGEKSLYMSKSELLGKSLLLVEERIFGEKNIRDMADFSLYAHDLVEISIVCSGHGVHRILNNDIPCGEGDIYFINADVPHGYFADNDCDRLCVQRIVFDANDWFEGSIADSESSDFCYGVFRDNSATSCARLTFQVMEELKGYFRLILEELHGKGADWKTVVRSSLSMLLIKSGRYINGAIKTIPCASKKEWRIMTQTVNYVMEHFDNCDLKLETVAAELFVSPSQLSRMFKSLTGVSFSEYLRTVRIDRACEFLRVSEMTIEEIVHASGLKDIPCFYRAFSARNNMTPNEYRLKQRETYTEKEKGKKIMVILSEISANLQAGKAKLVKEMVQQAIDEGVSVETILNEGLVHGMNIVGEKFRNNEVFVPEVLVAARAMNQGAAILKPLLVSAGVASLGRVCIGTVHGDLHDIGKNLVKMMLEGKGFEVIDLGVDVEADTFVKAAVENECDIICCSALLTTTMGVMADVVKAAEAAGIRDKVKIMVGGAPVSEEFAKQIGADVYSTDAATCANMAVELVKGK